MRTYEALYIVKPTLTDDEIQTVVNGVDQLVTDNGGAIVRSEIWGKRRLAYEVNKFQEGVYVLTRFTSPNDFIKKLREYIRLEDAIIRHLVVHFDERTLKLEEEQEARNKVLQESRAAGGFGGRGDDDDDDDDDDRPRRRPAPRPAPAPRADSAPPADAKPEQPKPEEPKAEEPKAEEPKAEEPKAEEPKAAEAEAAEPAAEEPKPESETTAEV